MPALTSARLIPMQRIIDAGINHYRYLPIALLIQRNPVTLTWYYSQNDISKRLSQVLDVREQKNSRLVGFGSIPRVRLDK